VPTGEKDPFALRRHALGVLRILIEQKLPIDLMTLLIEAHRAFANEPQVADSTNALYEFFMDRLRGLLRERGYTAGEIDAVLSLNPTLLDDVLARLEAVREFTALPEAAALAAANKRISNILRKSEVELHAVDAASTPNGAERYNIVERLLVEDAEKALYGRLDQVTPTIELQLAQRDYTRALSALAALREPVDTFFNDVMVNAEEADLRKNRLGLLAVLHGLMNRVADISKLAA
jgi:glycyl-tRNA synthetase beta chain